MQSPLVHRRLGRTHDKALLEDVDAALEKMGGKVSKF